MSDAPASRAVSKGLIQINLRLSRVLELLEGGTREASSAPVDSLPILFDLLDAAARTVDPDPLPVPHSWWPFGRRDRVPDLRGLRIALEAAHDHLSAHGVVLTNDGPIDPRLHRVVDVTPTSDPAMDRHVARVIRQGWITTGTPARVLRPADVVAFRLEKTP